MFLLEMRCFGASFGILEEIIAFSFDILPILPKNIACLPHFKKTSHIRQFYQKTSHFIYFSLKTSHFGQVYRKHRISSISPKKTSNSLHFSKKTSNFLYFSSDILKMLRFIEKTSHFSYFFDSSHQNSYVVTLKTTKMYNFLITNLLHLPPLHRWICMN